MFPFLLLFQKITTAKPFNLSNIHSQFKFLSVLASCRKSLVCIVSFSSEEYALIHSNIFPKIHI